VRGVTDLPLLAATVDRIDAWACTVPLERPIDFGRFFVRERHHTALRLRTRDGLTCDVLGQSRGAPVDVALLDVLAPRVLGRSALEISRIEEEVDAALAALEREGTLGRAWSLIELGLHGLRAAAFGVPLWRLLGGDPRPVAALVVEGYALADEHDDAFAERLAARAAQGYRAIKIEAAHYPTDDALLDRLAAVRRRVHNDTSLVLDFAWTWRDVRSKARLLSRLPEFGIAWLEDAFPRTRVGQYVELRSTTQLPVGCGDEATRADDLFALASARAVDVLRADATTIGGLGATRRVVDSARDAGCRMSFHERPEIHEHLVFGWRCADHVELFTRDRPFDAAHRLLVDTPESRVRDGWLSPPDAVGLGVQFDEGAVRRYAVRHGARGTAA
jgi:L-alanine-DL-glutamate epimerase-like enolase superfamily enzyme